jgi:hypothetical protein
MCSCLTGHISRTPQGPMDERFLVGCRLLLAIRGPSWLGRVGHSSVLPCGSICPFSLLRAIIRLPVRPS